jgi:hypothetical protein
MGVGLEGIFQYNFIAEKCSALATPDLTGSPDIAMGYFTEPNVLTKVSYLFYDFISKSRIQVSIYSFRILRKCIGQALSPMVRIRLLHWESVSGLQ